MSYDVAMKAAGAKVIEYKQFGSYQGDWWALVEFKGHRGWVHASYGSCSGCDAFEAEMGWDSHSHSDNDYVSVTDISSWRNDCETCLGYRKKMVAFGADYLNSMMTQAEAESYLEKTIEEWDWQDQGKEALAFIREPR